VPSDLAASAASNPTIMQQLFRTAYFNPGAQLSPEQSAMAQRVAADPSTTGGAQTGLNYDAAGNPIQSPVFR